MVRNMRILSIVFIFGFFSAFSQSGKKALKLAQESFYELNYNTALQEYTQASQALKAAGDWENYYVSQAERAWLELLFDDYDAFFGTIEDDVEPLLARYGEQSPEAGYFNFLLGQYFYWQEQYDSSAAYFHSSIALIQPQPKKAQHFLGFVYESLGDMYNWQDQSDSAVFYYEKAYDYLLKEIGGDKKWMVNFYNNYALCLQNISQSQKALDIHLKNLELGKVKNGSASIEVARTLQNIGVVYSDGLKDPEQAIVYYEQALEAYIKLKGNASPEVATMHYNLGNTYDALDNHEKSIHHGRIAINLRRKNAGENDLGTARAYSSQGNHFYNNGDFEEAITHYTKSLKIFETNYDTSHRLTLRERERLADALNSFDREQEALPFYLQNIEIIQEMPDSDSLLTAKTYQDAANCYADLDQTEKAIGLYQTALDYFKVDTLNKWHIKCMSDFAKALNDYYQFFDAKTLAEKALALAIEIDLNPRERYTIHRNLSFILKELNQLREALREFKLAVQLAEHGLNADHPFKISLYNNLGLYYADLGLYDSASMFYKKSIELTEKLYGEKDHNATYALNNYAIALMHQGKSEEALTHSKRSVDISESSFDSNSPELAGDYLNYGILLDNIGRPYEAIEMMEKALNIYRSVDAHSKDVALCYNNLGTVYQNINQEFKAKTLYEIAIQLYEGIYGKNSRDAILVRINAIEAIGYDYDAALKELKKLIPLTTELSDQTLLASLYEKSARFYDLVGQEEQAIAHFDSAIALYENTYGSMSSKVYACLVNKSLALEQLEKYDEEVVLLNKAMEILTQTHDDESEKTRVRHILIGALKANGKPQEARALIEQTEQDLKFFSARISYHQHYLFYVQKAKYLLEFESDQLEPIFETIALANDFKQKGQSQLLNESDQITNAYAASNTLGLEVAILAHDRAPTDKTLDRILYFMEASKSSVLTRSISNRSFADTDVDRQLFEKKALLVRVDAALSIAEEPSVIARLHDRKLEILTAIESLEQTTMKWVDEPREISTSALQESLEEGTAVLQYDFTRDTLVSLLITKNSTKVSYHNYDENAFSKSLLALNNSVLFKISAALDAAGKRVYESLFDPVEKHLESESISKLIIIPSGPLNTLPFELLRRSGEDPFLIEKYQITYHNSLSLREAIATRELKERPSEMIAFAPVFDQNNKLNLDASRFVREAIAPSLGTSRSFSFDQELQPLPGTKTEVEQLNSLFEGATINAQYFLQSEASEDRVKALDYNKVKYLHFATHGFVNALNPNKSGLFLDPSSNGIEDGILFANEIELLQLNAELVSLSACETGLGTYFMGEGIVGLSRSFFLAGARRVLVSQWKVNDESTKQLMINFYHELLSTGNYAQSLQKAKIKLIQSEQFNHPYYWAPFKLIGY